MSVAKGCLAFSGLFEAEVLVELMLRYWSHPLADDQDFRNALLESAASVLQACVAGQKIMEDIPPEKTSFITAVWYVEWNTVGTGAEDADGQRQAWLEKVRIALPSCFCPPENLP
jgi:hypothetical protein